MQFVVLARPTKLIGKFDLHSGVCVHNIHTMTDLTKITGFDWDDGNARKSTEKHDVSMAEAEQVFFNDPLLLLEDAKHSQRESRNHALGKTDEGRLLHITFTLRHTREKIRVISARDMHKKERKIYEQTT